jgi:uncharacterized Fe-S center protein
MQRSLSYGSPRNHRGESLQHVLGVHACPFCVASCPLEAIHFVGKENLSLALASAAYGVLSTFAPDKVSYVSFAKDIAEACDCAPNPEA